LSPAATGRRDAQLFDAVWGTVIEGLGRSGQPERANKAFEEMLERLSADAAAVASKSGKSAGWRGNQTALPARRDPRIFDAYLRAGLPHFLHYAKPLSNTHYLFLFSCFSAISFSTCVRYL
jgi:pentatricopeptide repeat protein